MTKQELIDRITTVNRSAKREFLADFSEGNLSDYVRQLDTLDSLPTQHKVCHLGVCQTTSHVPSPG